MGREGRGGFPESNCYTGSFSPSLCVSYNQWRLRQVTSVLQSKHGRRESVREENAFDRQRQTEREREDKERENIATMEARRNNVAAGPTGDPLMLLGVIAGDLTFA